MQGCPHMSACSADGSEQQHTLHTHSMHGAGQASYIISAMQFNISQKQCLKCTKDEGQYFLLENTGEQLACVVSCTHFLMPREQV